MRGNQKHDQTQVTLIKREKRLRAQWCVDMSPGTYTGD